MNCKKSVVLGKRNYKIQLVINKIAGFNRLGIFEKRKYLVFKNLEWVSLDENGDNIGFGSFYNKFGDKNIAKIKQGYKIKIINNYKIELNNVLDKIIIDDVLIFNYI
ncbi:hypothetical protein EOM39_00230 [Candidatus Gracilibacteria bacterium]|nr:hypothetical protein [Candidatus Gracilibacteria bacterium]